MTVQNNQTLSPLTPLEECVNTLNQLSETCCMAERSPKMQQAYDELQATLASAKQAYINTETAHTCINHIGTLGATIGFLYATCCTDTRERLYQSIFKALMDTHVKMYAILGHSH